MTGLLKGPIESKSYLALDIYLGSCSEKNLDNVNMIVFTGPMKRSHDQLESRKEKTSVNYSMY